MGWGNPNYFCSLTPVGAAECLPGVQWQMLAVGENPMEVAAGVLLGTKLSHSSCQTWGFRGHGWQELKKVSRPQSSGLEFPSGLLLAVSRRLGGN